MSTYFLVVITLVTLLSAVVTAGGHGGGHKKVVIHVPFKVKHHHHTHTIVKHVHHKHKGGGGGGDDHYELLGYTYGQPKKTEPHFSGGHGWGAADDTENDYGDSPVSYAGDGGYGFSADQGESPEY